MNNTERHIIKTYSALLEGLNYNGKKKLIENLSHSLQINVETREADFCNSFGAFGSNNYKPAEEIIADIRSGRKFGDKEIRF